MDKNTNLEKLEKECKIIFFISSGPGGQRKNRKKTAVKLIHIPTGTTVTITKFRFQYQNRRYALIKLKEKLQKLKEQRKPRVLTKPPFYAKEERLKIKKIRSFKKQLRKKVKLSEIEN
jgi:protein subunit release factor B